MRCTVCGTPLPAGARQCSRCGTFVAAPPDSGAYVPPTVAVPPVNQGAPQSPPGAYPPAGQGGFQSSPPMFPPGGMPPTDQRGEPVPPTAYAPSRQSSPAMPGAYPNNPPGGMAGNQNMYQQGVPPLPLQSVPPLPNQYRHSTGDDGSGKKGSRALIIGLIALVVILLVGGVPVLLSRNSSNTSQNNNTTGNTGSTGTGQTSSVAATATALATGPKLPPNEKNPYPPGTGTLILKDPMHDNSQGYMWQEGTANGITCRFSSGQYHVIKASGSALCIPQSPTVAAQNVTVEANLNLQSGTYMGLATRIDPQKGTGYLFVVGTDGTYAINKVNIKTTGSGQVQQLSQGFSPALPFGANQVKMGVVVRGAQLSLFVNNQPIISIDDAKLNNSGGVGLFVNGNSSLNLAVSNVRVWKL